MSKEKNLKVSKLMVISGTTFVFASTLYSCFSFVPTEIMVNDNDLIPFTIENKEGSFGIKSFEAKATSLKGTVFFMDKLGLGSSKSLNVSGIARNTDYNYIVACSERCEIKVSKGQSGNFYYDGVRYLENNGKFLLAGFTNPSFDALKLEIVSKSSNNIVTAGVFKNSNISPKAFLSPTVSNNLYGNVGSNIEVFSLPTTLSYLGITPVSKAQFNRKAFPKMALFLASLNATGQLTNNNSYAGSYNKRYISGTTTWSNHSWGAAVDLLTHDNKGKSLSYNQTSQLVSEKSKNIASRLGIAWGGYWSGSSYDPMHWEVINPEF